MPVITSIDDLRDLAQRRVPKMFFDYADSGSYTEQTLRDNTSDFDKIRLRQRVAVDMEGRSLATQMVGEDVSMPLALAPVGLTGMQHADGEILVAQAAEEAGVPFTLSTMSICSIEDVAENTTKPFWFQLYFMRDRDFIERLIQRAYDAGCSALVLTLDLQILGQRHKDLKNGMTAPPKLTILRAVITPELGGDTMFAAMRAAYAGLSDRMQRHIAGLTARHGFGRFDRLLRNDPEGVRKLYEVEQLHPRQDHPVVAMHPETGLPVLYVNRHFSERINELPEDEGRAVLDFLLGQTARPEYQLRVSWEPGTVVMWDNRSVQHYAPHDYFPQRRRMERVTVAGSVPIPDGQSGEVRVDKVEVDDVHVDPGDGQAAPTRQFQRG